MEICRVQLRLFGIAGRLADSAPFTAFLLEALQRLEKLRLQPLAVPG